MTKKQPAVCSWTHVCDFDDDYYDTACGDAMIRLASMVLTRRAGRWP
jgi:hypothetical protein